MNKPLTPRSSAKRAAVLDAAQACFLEKGYAGTSMDLVAAKAGVSKATIYSHFASKDDLFGAIICRRCEDQVLGLGAMDGIPQTGSDARQILTAIATHLMNMLLTPEVLEIYRMVIAESPRYPDLARIYWEQGPMRGKARIAELLAQMDRQGLLSIPDSWAATDRFVSMLRGEHFHRMLMGLPPHPTNDMAATISDTVQVMLKTYGLAS